MILVDSSAWIEHLRATGSPADVRLTRATEDQEALATTGFVILEVLAGARDKRHALKLSGLLARCEPLPAEEPTDHEAAAVLFRAARRAGWTVRRLQDCLIAAVAIREDVEVLHQDRDFEAIAKVSPLRLTPLS